MHLTETIVSPPAGIDRERLSENQPLGPPLGRWHLGHGRFGIVGDAANRCDRSPKSGNIPNDRCSTEDVPYAPRDCSIDSLSSFARRTGADRSPVGLPVTSLRATIHDTTPLRPQRSESRRADPIPPCRHSLYGHQSGVAAAAPTSPWAEAIFCPDPNADLGHAPAALASYGRTAAYTTSPSQFASRFRLFWRLQWAPSRHFPRCPPRSQPLPHREIFNERRNWSRTGQTDTVTTSRLGNGCDPLFCCSATVAE